MTIWLSSTTTTCWLVRCKSTPSRAPSPMLRAGSPTTRREPPSSPTPSRATTTSGRCATTAGVPRIAGTRSGGARRTGPSKPPSSAKSLPGRSGSQPACRPSPCARPSAAWGSTACGLRSAPAIVASTAMAVIRRSTSPSTRRSGAPAASFTSFPPCRSAPRRSTSFRLPNSPCAGGWRCWRSASASGTGRRGARCSPGSVYGRRYAPAGEFAESVAETSRQLEQALQRLGRPADLVVLPCCDQVLALAVARHLERRRFAARPHILLWLLYGPHYRKAIDDPMAVGLYGECRDAFASLLDSVGNRGLIQGYCETREMAEFYRALVDLEVEVMPGPGLALAPHARRSRAPGKPPTVLCIGFANRPKGYRLLPQALDS